MSETIKLVPVYGWQCSYLKEDTQLELVVDIQSVEDNQMVENIRNLVEQGSSVVVETHQAVLETHLAVLDILPVAVESLAVENMQDIPGLLHTVDIPDTSHTCKLHTIIQKYISLYIY